MSNPSEIYWSQEKVAGLSYVPGVDVKVPCVRGSSKASNLKEKQNTALIKPSTLTLKAGNSKKTNMSPIVQHKVTSKSTNSSINKPQLASLKDLCPEDKERVANLIRELAKTGEEKEATECKLNDERKEFAIQINELKTDKEKIEQEQRTLLSEFKECQRLLVFYQQKITEEQKEVARDINRLLTESSYRKSGPSSLSKSSPRHANVGTDELDHDIIVKDVEATSSSQRSVETTPRQADIAGSLGESFCPYQNEAAPEISCLPFYGPRTSPSNNAYRHKHRKSRTTKRGHYGRSDAAEEQTADIPLESETDDCIRDLTNVFEHRIRGLSPNGRRVALLRQKQELEVEQAHLQQMLAEQEKILKFRQQELEKRHIEYTKRMRHFKQHGSFPSSTSGFLDSEQENNFESDYIDRDNAASELVSAFDEPTPILKMSTPLKHRSRRKGNPRSEPALRRKKFTNRSTSQQSVTPRFHEREEQSLLSNSYPARRSLLSYHRHSFDNGDSASGLRSCNLAPRSVINDITNLSVNDRAASSAISTSHPSDLNSRKQKKGRPESHDSSLHRHDKLPLGRKSHHRSTMNNLSTLSDLVFSVEESQSAKPSEVSSVVAGSPAFNDTLISTTFDPEDSQLLEDIFFIK